MRMLAATLIIALGSAAHADAAKHKPPQAAFDACAKAKKGDACAFTGRNDREVKGTCGTPRDGGSALVCRRQRPDKSGSGSADGHK